MDLSDYVAALRKRWLVLAVLGLVGGSLGYLQAGATTPMYRATSSVWVSLGQGETVSELVQGTTYVQNLVQSYAQLATMPTVLEPVIEELELDISARALARTISADTPLNTVIIEISAVSADPERAAAVADAVSRQLDEAAQEVAPARADGTASVSMRTVASAHVPTVPFVPNTKLLTATGILLGVAAGIAFAVIRELLDTKVRSGRDVARVTESAVLGTIGFERRLREHQLVMRSDARSPRAESYRRLKTNLQFLDVGRKVHSIVVTSALAGEGKSTTAINLALAVAEDSRKALLVDADLRRPSVAEYCGIEGVAGLTSVLIGKATLADVVQPWGHPNLHVLASGALPPNPSQMLGSPAMAELLAEITQTYDMVIFDSAPLLPVADAAILSRISDGAVVVAGCRKVHRNQLADALRALESVGASCLGIVVNRVAQRESDGYYSYGAAPASPRHRRRFRRRKSTAAIADDLLGETAGSSDPLPHESEAARAQTQEPPVPRQLDVMVEDAPEPAATGSRAT
ncbi:polysaccharide biosynthesis tyrosine autokinase [Actinotalea sp. K2]|uniref:polysaccharide biosynthesis tyrosine autokinase n=1 Tax=Actinotalea sp. K2 TaxID=2939438 RepID=UPI002017ED9F|nr:polysaccharide biosynthesis tyrosine autokinase [Actinotalea sp. K2]MCL3861298.1 polysaccharide biosynthesis tyrosine autokinase [Actinotalea sp. K2]